MNWYFCRIGGSGEIGMNLNLYGFGPASHRKWIMIDCGVLFGDLTTPGIDLLCPDPSYILDEKENLLGLVLTHGHEDHIGAVALLAPKLGCPLYATPFTAELVRRKLDEAGAHDVELNLLDLDARFELGPFDLEFVTLTHSIPEPNGVIIRTPLGTCLHTGDWKIDPDPTLGPRTDDRALKKLGDEGVLAMICDSTNVFSSGVSGSEAMVRKNLIEVIGAQRGRVAVTTFASNLARVISVCEAAHAVDRNVCLLGRSMVRIVDIARKLELVPERLSFIDPRDAGYLPRENVLYLCTGSQGEARAALARIARDDHRDLTLNEGDTVIFSSKIIPGNEREIFALQNDLTDIGVHIITEKDADIHVSGHPCKEELREMYGWVRPQISIPVHGEARHLETHADFALELGADDALAPRNGDLIRLAPDGPVVIDEVPNGRLVQDGTVILHEGTPSVRERKKASYAGMVMVSLVLRANSLTHVLATCYGVPQKLRDFDEPPGTQADTELSTDQRLTTALFDALTSAKKSTLGDDEELTILVKRSVRRILDAQWGMRPQILTQIHR